MKAGNTISLITLNNLDITIPKDTNDMLELLYNKINNNEKSLLYDGINNPIYDLDSSSNLYFDKIIDNNGCIKKTDFGFFHYY